MTEFSFAIIGGGSIGTRHARNLKSLGQARLLIIEPQPDRAQVLQAEGFSVSPHLADAFAPAIEAVLICSPTIFHLEHLGQAIAARKHIFIEKPIAHTLEGVAELIWQAQGLVTLVGFNMRFRDGFKRVQSLIQEGRIGKPLAVRANASYYLPHYHPDQDYRTRYQAQRRLGGGVVLDDIHEIDYLMALFGGVTEIYAHVARLSDLEIDTEDYAGMMLKHASGVITQLQLDFLQHVYRRTLEVTGSLATLTLDHNSGEIRVFGSADHHYTVYPQKMNVTLNQMYIDELTHFIECLAGRATPLADLKHGYEVLRVALAAFEASEKNEVIKL